MEKNIKVYTQASCMKCVMVKNFLDGEGVTYTEEYLETEEDRQKLRDKGYMSTPVTEIGDQVIHGFDITGLKKALG